MFNAAFSGVETCRSAQRQQRCSTVTSPTSSSRIFVILRDLAAALLHADWSDVLPTHGAPIPGAVANDAPAAGVQASFSQRNSKVEGQSCHKKGEGKTPKPLNITNSGHPHNFTAVNIMLCYAGWALVTTWCRSNPFQKKKNFIFFCKK